MNILLVLLVKKFSLFIVHGCKYICWVTLCVLFLFIFIFFFNISIWELCLCFIINANMVWEPFINEHSSWHLAALMIVLLPCTRGLDNRHPFDVLFYFRRLSSLFCAPVPLMVVFFAPPYSHYGPCTLSLCPIIPIVSFYYGPRST